MADTLTTEVGTAVKTEVTAVETSAKTTLEADVAALKAKVAAIEAASYPFHTVAVVAVVAYVVGLLTPFILHHVL